jgi:formate hydrogenlyase subunit 3/multisubunit Na+/H+ antiporter MnhD subunit
VTATTPGGWLLVLALVLPAGAMLVAFVAGGRHAQRIAIGTLALWLATALGIAWQVQRGGVPLVHVIGGWQPPLGMALRADGLSAAMLLAGAFVLLAAALFGRAP